MVFKELFQICYFAYLVYLPPGFRFLKDFIADREDIYLNFHFWMEKFFYNNFEIFVFQALMCLCLVHRL